MKKRKSSDHNTGGKRMTVSAHRRLSIAILGVILTCLTSLHAQPTLQITSPANGTVFSPGQTITVSVSPSGAGFSMIGVGGEDPLGFAGFVSTPPYQFSIQIPTTITPKQYTLTAMGVVTGGQAVSSPQIRVAVQRPDSPVSLNVQPSMLQLNVGDNGYLTVWGTYSDSSVAYLTQAASTTFVSNSPTIATVSNYGIVTAVSSGSTTIVVNGTSQVPITVAPALKIAPRQKALYAGQSQQFFPTLASSSVPSVTWSINPPGVGSVSGTGVYTAPSPLALSQTVLLTATDASNDTATATITLLPALAMSLTPSSVNLSASQTAQFYTSLSNTVNYGVNWSIAPAGVGQISPLGLYTAPASITSPQTVTVTATSTVDGTTAASATINLLPPPAVTVTTAANASATYSAASQVVALSAIVTSTGGTIGSGTVTFTVMQGTTVIGAPVSATVASGAASASFMLPAGTAAGVYTIAAVYNPGPAFMASSDNTHTLTVTNAPIDVTSLVSMAATGLGYNRGTKLFGGTVTITNASASTINAPLQLVLNNLYLTPGITLSNATGSTAGGSPYITSNTMLAPGASVTITLLISDPTNAEIGYTPQVLSGSF
jgi:hypothetical protein